MELLNPRRRADLSLHVAASWLLLCALAPSGCRDDHHHRAAPPPEPGVLQRLISKSPTAVAYVTMNRRWAPQDIEDLGILFSESVPWEGGPGTDDPVYEEGQVVPFTTRATVYQKQREKCVEDFLYGPRNSDGEPTCYPEPTEIDPDTREIQGRIAGGRCTALSMTLSKIRYGRYCGAGYPDFGVWLDNRRTRGDPSIDVAPLDGVDYCCRLHDANTWDADNLLGAAAQQNVCGWVMCVSQASSLPPDALDTLFPDTRDARQCIYDRATRLLSTCAPRNFPDLARAPDLGSLPAPPHTRQDPQTGQAIQAVD